MNLPVFDGVREALKSHNIRRKRGLEREKQTPVKKRRIELTKRRVLEGCKRSEWTRKHGQDTYYCDIEVDWEEKQNKSSKGKRRKPSVRSKMESTLCMWIN